MSAGPFAARVCAERAKDKVLHRASVLTRGPESSSAVRIAGLLRPEGRHGCPQYSVPASKRTIRNSWYKCGQSSSGIEKMADLVADPWETENVLAHPLSPAERAAYDELKAVLAAGKGR